MKKKYKVFLLTLGVFLLISLSISISYAYYLFSVSQEGVNALNSDCFKITYSDSNAINLLDTIPLSEEEASNLTPYTFTINNICNHAIDYNVNIETLDDTTIDLNAIRYRLDNKSSNLLGSIEDNDSSTYVNNNVSSSKTIANGSMRANSSKTFKLKIWIDEDSTKEQAADKIFKSKVVVYSSLNPNYSESILTNGKDFNIAIKTLAGDENPTYNTDNTSIISLQRSLVEPSEENNAIDVSDSTSDSPIYAWFDNGIIYLYTKNSKIYLNSDSSYTFNRLKSITSLDLSNFDSSKVNNMFSIFEYNSKLESLDLSNFDTSNVTNMAYMFTGLMKINYLDVSNLDTSKVEFMQLMFQGMNSLASLDLSNFDTSNVIYMFDMFSGMESLTSLDVSHFDTSKVKRMDYMFCNLKKLNSLDVSNFDTSNVTNMKAMFLNVKNVTELDVSHFDTSKVTDMSSMFNSMDNLLKLDVSHFDTSKVTNMNRMFVRLKKVKFLDLSNFDTSNVTLMGRMFAYSYDLTTIYVGNNWNISNLTNNDSEYEKEWGSKEMFYGDTNLIGGSGTTFDSNYVDETYARVDDPDNGKPGYLTLKTN